MKKLGFIAVALYLVIKVLSGTVSHAEEASNNVSAREVIEPLPSEKPNATWDAYIYSLWLPESDSSGSVGRVGMSETKVKFGRTCQVTPRLNITPDISYSLLHVSAPDAARLPETLHAVTVGLRGNYRINSKFSINVQVAPGLAGDFKRIGTDDIRVRTAFAGHYNISDKLAVLAGLIYQDGYKSLPVFPIIGAIYRPDEQWTINLTAPRPGVIYAPGKGVHYYLGGEIYGGEYQLHDTTLGAQIIRYQDFRIVGGADFTILAPLKGELAAGYAFSREFVFYDVFDATRRDIRIDDGPFVRTGLKMVW